MQDRMHCHPLITQWTCATITLWRNNNNSISWNNKNKTNSKTYSIDLIKIKTNICKKHRMMYKGLIWYRWRISRLCSRMFRINRWCKRICRWIWCNNKNQFKFSNKINSFSKTMILYWYKISSNNSSINRTIRIYLFKSLKFQI